MIGMVLRRVFVIAACILAVVDLTPRAPVGADPSIENIGLEKIAFSTPLARNAINRAGWEGPVLEHRLVPLSYCFLQKNGSQPALRSVSRKRGFRGPSGVLILKRRDLPSGCSSRWITPNSGLTQI